MDRFGPTRKVSEKLVHLLRWTTYPGRTGLFLVEWIAPLDKHYRGNGTELFVAGLKVKTKLSADTMPKQCFNFQLFSQDFKGVTCQEHLPHH